MPLEQFSIHEGFAQPLNMTESHNVFALQNKMSDQLNTYQTKYARYMRCNSASTNNEVSNPACDLDNGDSFSSLTEAYKSLSSTMDELSTIYKNHTTEGSKTPEQYDHDAKLIPDEYKNLLDLRSELDQQLAFLQEQIKTRGGEPARRLDGQFLVNTLLVIVAFSILYYIILGM